jgi:hypothetical protein
MGENRQGNPVMTIMILLIINAINGMGSAAVGLIWSDNALSAIGLLLAIVAIWVALNIKTLKIEWWNYAVLLNIAALVLYLFASLEFLIVGEVLSVLTLLLLNMSSVKQQFK